MSLSDQSVFKRIYWRILSSIGFKRLVWDQQFRAGVWSDLPRCPITSKKVIELCGGGFLVEFGCAEGKLPLSLPVGSFSQYLGYDISEVAVQTAAEAVAAANLPSCRFQQCDMAQWEGCSGANLIVVEECLYYLAQVDAERFLRRCCDSLAGEGKVLVVFHSAAKHAASIDTCRRVCKVLSSNDVDGRTFLVLCRK